VTQVGEVEHFPPLLVPDQLRDVITKNSNNDQILMSFCFAQIPHLLRQGSGVQRAGVREDFYPLRDDVVQTCFELLEEAVLVGQVRAILLDDGVPCDVHFREPVARDHVDGVFGGHAGQGVGTVARGAGDVADSDGAFGYHSSWFMHRLSLKPIAWVPRMV
jgi:hypothetical protein